MPRLKFAVVLLFGLAVSAAAGPREAANVLFDDPVEREAFFAMMTADPKLTAAVAKAEASGNLKAAPETAAWRKSVLESLTKTRTALAAGIRENPPKTVYPEAPLVAPLMKGLGRKNPADLYVSVSASLNKHAPAAAPVAKTAAPCPAGTSRSKVLDSLKASAATGGLAPVTGDVGDCHPVPPAPIPPAEVKTPPAQTADVKTPPASTPPAVTDQRTTTGAPPSPGHDEDKKGGDDKGFFGSLPWDAMKGGAGIGAAVGMVLAFGTPLGIIGGALIGAVAGGLLLSGALGKIFGGGKSDSSDS